MSPDNAVSAVASDALRRRALIRLARAGENLEQAGRNLRVRRARRATLRSHIIAARDLGVAVREIAQVLGWSTQAVYKLVNDERMQQ